jgi:LuxR family maltose regulon positive regulatory protein
MTKVPAYTLAWSSAGETYELYQTRDRGVLNILPESPEWFTWLEQVSSFAFVGKSSHYTVRKEAKQRGDRYWYAYFAMGEHLTKKYLGKTANLTLARMEQIAGVLDAQRADQASLPMTLSGDANREVDATPGSLLAQRTLPLYPPLPTKLHAPHPRASLVPRSHLTERIRQGAHHALTLVSAPPGFGKTTLLAQWLAGSELPTAWLSLEAEDNDPSRFLSYLIAALQTLDELVGTTAMAMLHTLQPASPEMVFSVLANELVERGGGDIALVLDDYHSITSESIQRGMTFLLEHLPPQLHLVLATRADPSLPLARLRAQGQLTEVRAADLRFGTAEASAFLQGVMGLDMQDEAISTLAQRTEGWIAGLQLAALSLQGRTDVSAFLAAFSGSHRYVLDYLSEEVLGRQDAAVQQFLLHTCILERLSGPLCDAVTGQGESQGMLEALERGNLFVVALDDWRGWYRYHHLFAEVLRRHLQQREPTLPPELHLRASVWYEQHDLTIEAIQHALVVPDVEFAARLIEPIAFSMVFQGQISTILRWINSLPEALIQTRPFLCICHAGLLTINNKFEESEARLQDAERGIQEEMPAEQVRTIRGYVLSIRGDHALFSGDIKQAVFLSHQALDLLPEAEELARAAARATITRAYLESGDVTSDTEHEVIAVDALIRASGNLLSTMSSMTLLARLHIQQGRLHQADATYRQAMQAVSRPEVLPTMFSSLSYYFGLGDLLREWNELDMAEQHLTQGMAMINETLTVEPFVAVLGYSSLARLEQARSNFHAAFATLDRFLLLAEQRHFPQHLLSQVAAVRAQVELAQGNMATAIRWANSSGLSTEDDDLPYTREGEYLALTRVRIAQELDNTAIPFLQDVLHLLDRLLQNAEAKARMGSALEILVLQALAMDAQGNRTCALSTLEQALLLAEPEGYIRLFVDEGSPMLTLLRRAHARSRVPGYVATLLSAFGEQFISEFPSTSARPGALAEPLTEREREVLGLLLEGASNREIARRLVVSVNTVKRHIYNLCGKLGVQSRAQAIVRARDLNLV